MIYNISGTGINSAFNLNGENIDSAFNIDGDKIFESGESPPNRNKPNYDYYDDQDPLKSYAWSYSLQDLKALQNGNFTIGVQTDTHMHGDDESTGTPLKNMTKQLYFDFICNLGDMPQGYGSDTTEATRTYITTMLDRYTDYVESPFLIANGNHDNAAMSNPIISKSDMYDYYMGAVKGTTNIVEKGTPNLYYYKDFYECRVIVLDTCEYADGGDGGVHKALVSSEQITWLTNTALDTEKPVLILCHIPLLSTLTSDTVTNRDLVLSALQNFISGGGTVVAVLCGHTHERRSEKSNGINHIVFDNGGTFAEVVFIDFDQRTITTTGINVSSVSRSFTF